MGLAAASAVLECCINPCDHAKFVSIDQRALLFNGFGDDERGNNEHRGGGQRGCQQFLCSH